MAKRVERKELRLRVTSWWVVLFAVGFYVAFQLITSTPAEATPERMMGWIVTGVSLGLYLLGALVLWDYRSYAKKMLPIINGCSDHPSYQGRGDVKSYICPTCDAIRQARLNLFPEERKPVG